MVTITIESPELGRQSFTFDHFELAREIGVRYLDKRKSRLADGDARMIIRAWSGCESFETWRSEQ